MSYLMRIPSITIRHHFRRDFIFRLILRLFLKHLSNSANASFVSISFSLSSSINFSSSLFGIKFSALLSRESLVEYSVSPLVHEEHEDEKSASTLLILLTILGPLHRASDESFGFFWLLILLNLFIVLRMLRFGKVF